MPEGDTVWLAGRRLQAALAGRVLSTSDFRVPALANADLRGREVDEVVSRGKHLLTRVQGGTTLHTHLRMDGSWRLYRPGQRWRGGPAWQVRVVLANSEWQAVGYRLPVVELLPTADEHLAVGHLGPDILGPQWPPAGGVPTPPDMPEPRRDAAAVTAGFWVEAEAVRRLSGAAEQPVGMALLDQRNVAGIGTLYRAETLFLCGVHPRRPAGAVDLPQIVRMARSLLMANREHARQVTTGDPRWGRQHWVFDRAGLPCRRCTATIRQEELGPPGQERRSYWCPACQAR